MPTKNGLLKGPKVNKRHSTVLTIAEPIVNAARVFDAVKKISIGWISPLAAGQPRIRFQRLSAGVRMKVRGGDGEQSFVLYITDPSGVEQRLIAAWVNR